MPVDEACRVMYVCMYVCMYVLLALPTDSPTKVPEEKPVLMHGAFHKVSTNHGLSLSSVQSGGLGGGGGGREKAGKCFKMLPKLQLKNSQKQLDIVKTQPHKAVFRPKHVAVIVF